MLDKCLADRIESLRTSFVNRKNILLVELKRKDAFEEGDGFWSFIKKNSEIEIDKDGVTVSIRSKFENRNETRERKIKNFKNEAKNLVSDFVKGFNKIWFRESQKKEPEDWIGESSIIASSSQRGLSFKPGPNFIRTFSKSSARRSLKRLHNLRSLSTASNQTSGISSSEFFRVEPSPIFRESTTSPATSAILPSSDSERLTWREKFTGRSAKVRLAFIRVKDFDEFTPAKARKPSVRM